MRTIDMQTWPRRNHFKIFSSFDHPHFNMCVNVDLTAFYPYVKRSGHSFTVCVIYVIARTANTIPEFRYRLRGDQVVEHEVVNPGITVLVDKDLFNFCNLEYVEDFPEFVRRAEQKIAYVKAHPDMEPNPPGDDVLYTTSIPWVSFTSFSHPMQLHPGDSIPRFAWGKFFPENDRLKMPLSVQGHHAVMDGVHMGRYYETLQGYLDQPETVLGAA